jgi:hypothetical protein
LGVKPVWMPMRLAATLWARPGEVDSLSQGKGGHRLNTSVEKILDQIALHGFLRSVCKGRLQRRRMYVHGELRNLLILKS